MILENQYKVPGNIAFVGLTTFDWGWGGDVSHTLGAETQLYRWALMEEKDPAFSPPETGT